MITGAFFDVDETLITVKSMFRFLAFFYRECGRPEADADAVRADLSARAAAGAPRAETNRAYYGALAGYRQQDVCAAGEKWFAAELAEGEFIHAPAVARLLDHRVRGHLVVLVSGSFSACLEPVRRHLGADLAVGTAPAVAGGRYTGGIDGEPVIGPGKAAAATAVARREGVDLRRSYAYADDGSDLDLLRCVGHPVVVGGNPVLAAAAEVGGWPVLPGVPARAG